MVIILINGELPVIYDLKLYILTGRSACLITLGRTHELCLCRDISRVRRMSEIALRKNSECVLQPRLIKHEFVLFYSILCIIQ